MPRVNGVRQTKAGVRKVVTPSGAELEREFRAAFAARERRYGREPETRAQVRARFMGRVVA